jgi:hypothetical protein
MTPKVMKSLAAVVEQVVQQDLGRQHWQERQEQRRASGGQHVAEVAGRAHQRGGGCDPGRGVNWPRQSGERQHRLSPRVSELAPGLAVAAPLA